MTKEYTFEELEEELDDLLWRIKLCIEREKLENMWMETERTTFKDAAKVVFHYASQDRSYYASSHEKKIYVDKKGSLRNSSAVLYSHQVSCEKDLKEKVEEHGDVKGSLLSAINYLSKINEPQSFPLHEEHLFSLEMAAMSLVNKTSKYFGHEAGLDCGKIPKLDEKVLDRGLAIFEVFLKNASNPKRYPKDEYLFELVAERYDLKGSSLRRYYYNKDMNPLREVEVALKDNKKLKSKKNRKV